MRSKKEWLFIIVSYIFTLIFLILSYGTPKMVYACLLALLINIIFGLFNMKNRILFILFHVTMFLFILGRPLLLELFGCSWWGRYSNEANIYAHVSIFLSLFFVLMGCVIHDAIRKRENTNEILKVDKSLYISSLLIFSICIISSLICEFDKLLFMQGKSYEDFYRLYSTQVPYVFTLISRMTPFALCAFLACRPKKSISFLVLMLNVIRNIPLLIIGQRSPMILSILFAFTYYWYRDYYKQNDEKKWVGKYEKLLIIVAIPFFVLFLGIYNYIRSNDVINNDVDVVDVAIDFVYNQGTTFDTLLQGYDYQEALPKKDFNTYTFSAVVDYYTYGNIGRIFSKAPVIEDGNNIKKAMWQNDLSHQLSYIYMGAAYLNGQGRGSSYLLETYLDFGYLGVIIYSFILGYVMQSTLGLFNRNYILSTIALSSLEGFFFVCRGQSLLWISHLVQIYFPILMLGVLTSAYIFKAIYSRGNKINA